jgi:hypothetical protein
LLESFYQHQLLVVTGNKLALDHSSLTARTKQQIRKNNTLILAATYGPHPPTPAAGCHGNKLACNIIKLARQSTKSFIALLFIALSELFLMVKYI